MKSDFFEWLEVKDLGEDAPKVLNEAVGSSRYSVEVNYRTNFEEVLDAWAKLVLGYTSAAMKNCGYHCKIVFSKKPYRVLISTRNWDNGECVGFISFNPDLSCFVIGKGYYNKGKKTVKIESNRKFELKSASEIVKELRSHMEKLKKEEPKSSHKLNPIPMKRGPKSFSVKKLKKLPGPWKPKYPI